MKKLFFLLVMFAGLFIIKNTEARIKLVALPERETTIIRLDNPSSTLVEEERTLTLQKGVNKVDFSWKGVNIDSDSIRLKIITHPEKVKLLSVSYPPGEPALLWEIFSPEATEEKIRISYLLYYIDSIATYKLIIDKAETKSDMKSFLVVRNFSGEDFENAIFNPGYGSAFENSIKHEETKQLLIFEKESIPFKKMLTFDAAKLPWQPYKLRINVGIPVHYEFENSSSSALGYFPLKTGKARLFQQDGHGSTIFLGEDRISFSPVGKKFSLYISDSRDVVITQHKIKDRKINIKRNSSNRIILYDTDEIMNVKIENFKNTETKLTLIEHISRQWDMEESSHKYSKEDANTIKFIIKLKPKSKQTVTFHYHKRNIR